MFWWGLAHAWQRISAAWNGMIDGCRHIPADSSAVPSPYFRLILERGREAMDRITLGFYKADRRLLAGWVAAVGALPGAEETVREAARREVDARTEYEQIRGRAIAQDLERNPPDTWYCPPWPYRIAVVLLAIADAPLTFWAFQVFTLPNIYLIPVTILVVTALAALGHFAGEYTRKAKLPFKWVLGAILLLSVFLIVSLTYLRETALGEGGDVSPISSALVFVGVTAVGFVLPALLSLHLRHAPLQSDVASARRAWKAAGRQLRRARRRVVVLERRRDQAVAARRSELLTRRSQCKVVAAWTAKLLTIYINTNIRWRKDHQQAPGFDLLPDVAMPHGLDELEWTLPKAELYRPLVSAPAWTPGDD